MQHFADRPRRQHPGWGPTREGAARLRAALRTWRCARQCEPQSHLDDTTTRLSRLPVFVSLTSSDTLDAGSVLRSCREIQRAVRLVSAGIRGDGGFVVGRFHTQAESDGASSAVWDGPRGPPIPRIPGRQFSTARPWAWRAGSARSKMTSLRLARTVFASVGPPGVFGSSAIGSAGGPTSAGPARVVNEATSQNPVIPKATKIGYKIPKLKLGACGQNRPKKAGGRIGTTPKNTRSHLGASEIPAL